MNADTASATFNLIRVLPGAAGQSISFSYFDAGDAAGTGSVTVQRPTDATGSILTTPFPGSCKATGGSAGTGQTLTNCSAPLTQSGGVSRNNGKTETIIIPIPSDYTCNYNSFGGCWYRVVGRVRQRDGARRDDLGRDDHRRPGPAHQVATSRPQPAHAGAFPQVTVQRCDLVGDSGDSPAQEVTT